MTVLSNLGSILKREGDLTGALALFEKALHLAPETPELHNNIGNVYTELQHYDKALSAFGAAVALRDNYAVAHTNMGSLYKKRLQMVDAVACFSKAIQSDPNYAEAYDNLGRTLLDVGKPEESVTFLKQALRCKPDLANAVANLVFASMKLCRWDDLNQYGPMLDRLTRDALDNSQKPVEDPFLNISRCDDPRVNAEVAQAWSALLVRRTVVHQQTFAFKQRDPDKRLTIGYLSNNFHDHPMAHQMSGLFGRHDRDRFQINAYSCGPDDGSGYRQVIKRHCDTFVDLETMDLVQAAGRIHADQVDILVDTMGYTKGHRLDISILRPAPIQVRYLGMAGTCGADCFDYIIADRRIIPPEHRRHYSECVVYLPHCYQVNDDEQTITEKSIRRSDMGLPDDGFVFCSFNQAYKIDSLMYDSWMRILKNVPGSVLWLQGGQAAVENNLSAEAEKRGIPADRIIFAERLSRPQHLQRLQLADLALDTRMVNGAATTSDALWSGCPVLTVRGRHFASRMSASILSAIGLDNLVTGDLLEYETTATRLANHPDELATVRQELCRNRNTSPLFDTTGFTNALEAAYGSMWQHYVDGNPPQPFNLAPSDPT